LLDLVGYPAAEEISFVPAKLFEESYGVGYKTPRGVLEFIEVKLPEYVFDLVIGIVQCEKQGVYRACRGPLPRVLRFALCLSVRARSWLFDFLSRVMRRLISSAMDPSHPTTAEILQQEDFPLTFPNGDGFGQALPPGLRGLQHCKEGLRRRFPGEITPL
jgi:hypothetical protein